MHIGEKVKISQVVVVGLALILISGCSTYTGTRYSISVDNVLALKKYRDKSIGVGEFTATNPGKSLITCRGVGRIKTPDVETFESFIREALVSEMKLAEAYVEPGTIILTGNLNNIDFNSNSGFWEISLTVNSNNGNSLTIEDKYDYTTSWFGETACNQAAQALMPAVQNVIIKLIHHSNFEQLLNQI